VKKAKISAYVPDSTWRIPRERNAGGMFRSEASKVKRSIRMRFLANDAVPSEKSQRADVFVQTKA
jgi:hypothetical protein